MRILNIFWLLIACFGMAVLSQVGDESFLRNLKCFSGNTSDFFGKWMQCETGYLGNLIYRSVMKYSQLYTVDNFLRLSAVLSSLYAFCVVFYIIFTPEDKSLNYYGEPIDQSDDEMLDNEDTNSSTEVLVSYFNANRLPCVRSEASFGRRLSRSFVDLHQRCIIGVERDFRLRKSVSCEACISNEVLKVERLRKETKILESFSWRDEMPRQSIVFPRRSFSGSCLEMRRSVHEGVDRLCRSLSLMRVDLCSEGLKLVPDAIKTSSNTNLSTTSTRLALSPIPSSSYSSFKSLFSSVSSLDSVALSNYSQHTTWSVYNDGFTQRLWHSLHLLDSGEIGVKLPKKSVSCVACIWNHAQKEDTLLKENKILKSFSWEEEMQEKRIVFPRRNLSLPEMRRSVHEGFDRLCTTLSLTRVDFSSEGASLFHDTPITSSSSNHSTAESNTVDLINNTEVIVAEIPRPVKERIWSSMFELHDRREKSQSSAVYTSLSNLKFPNRTRRRRKLNLPREKQQVDQPEKATCSSFSKVLKEESYKQIVVPLLFHAGKELLLNVLTSF